MSCCGSPVEDDKYSEWRVESAYRAIKEAEEHKKDPKMMKLVAKLMDKEIGAIKSIEGLKEKLKEVVSKEE
jgi:hypothetical protein